MFRQAILLLILTSVVFTQSTAEDLANNIRDQVNDQINETVSNTVDNTFNKFQNWASTGKVSFDSFSKFENAFKTFTKNEKIASDLNNDNQGDGEGDQPTFGETEFSSMDPEDFAKIYLSFDAAAANATVDQSANIGNGRNLFEESDEQLGFLQTEADGKARYLATPASYDWRNYGKVGVVKNQGSCGSCWAFATVAMMESKYAIKYGSLYNFAEQQLLDCDSNQYGCNGGWVANAVTYIKSKGLTSTAKYGAYKAYKKTCTYSTSTSIAKTTGYANVGTNEATIASYLYSSGPLAVALNAAPLQYYKSGIINLSSASCNPNSLTHAVTLVGYGTSNGLNYWIVKNSWGSTWGEKGYFRIARGGGVCGINRLVQTAYIA